MAGKSIHYVNNTYELVEHIKNIKVETVECITLGDVSDLLTSVPVETATEIMKHKLEQDTELQLNKEQQWTLPHTTTMVLSKQHIFQELFYEQIEGIAMGSSVSSIVRQGSL